MAVVNLLLFGFGGYFALDFLSSMGYRNWESYVLGAFPPLTVLGAGLSVVLILLRQRRLASSAQYLVALAFLPSLAVMIHTFVINVPNHRIDPNILLSIVAPTSLVILTFAWFGWLLRRMDA